MRDEWGRGIEDRKELVASGVELLMPMATSTAATLRRWWKNYFCSWAGAVALGVVTTDIDTLP